MPKFTFHKVFNALKIILSYYYSRFRGVPLVWGIPMALSIEPTTSCNLRCPECPSGLRDFSRPTGRLSEALFKKIIDELSAELLYLTFYFQGEPYLHPKFLEMASYSVSKGVFTATSTNAHFFNDNIAKKTVESGIHRVVIAIDGTTQEVYEQYRKGGNLEKVIAGTKKLVAWKKQLKQKTPEIIFQFLVVRPNEHQITEIEALGKEIGVDKVVFKTAQIYDYRDGSPLIPEKSQYSRYQKQNDGTYRLKNKLLNHCWRMWHSAVITWDGKVVPCCFDKDAQHSMGDVQEQSFKKIWQNMGYQNFRASLLRSRAEIDICQNCTEGTKVWVE